LGVFTRATHRGLEGRVALMVSARELADRPGFRERFLRESRLAARLDHPSVVPVYDSREVDGELIVAMRLVKGGDLRRRIDREGPLPPEQAVALLGQVAEALDAAHSAGVVHRDVKPHNVLVEGDRAFLSDFGLAKALDDTAASRATVVGTAQYMSPEQWQGARVGPAADVYSLGCVLYEALTGIPPFERSEAETEPQLPEGIEAAIRRAVAKPRERFRSAGELIVAARAGEGSDVRPTAVLSHDPSERTTDRTWSNRFHIGPLRGRAAAAIAAALLAIAAAALVLVLGGSGPEVSTSPPLGRGTLRIAAGAKTIWVASERDGTLTRLNPASGRVVGRALSIGPGISGIAVGSKWLWATNPRRGDLLRIDPRSGRVLKTIHLGGSPGAIALGGGRVFVADERGAGVAAVSSAGGHVYRRGMPPHAAPLRLAVGAGGLWVSSASTGSVRRIDLGTLAVGQPIPVGRGPAGITVGRGLVWVANSRSNTVSRVDPSIHSVLGAPTPVGEQPGGIDAGTSAVWVASTGEDSVTRIDLANGETVGGPVPVGPEPGAVAVGGDAVWVANNGDGTVTRIEP
jgi:DNA-binding beta-propeller fold protein YncE